MTGRRSTTTRPSTTAGAKVVQGFVHRRAAHCASGSLRDLLEHHGLSYTAEPISEALVFGLAGGLGFGFGEFPDLQPPFILLGRTGDLERDFCRNMRLDFHLLETDDDEEGWGYVRERLDAGMPTMVWTDMKYLDYMRVRMHNTHHTVVVVGHDAGQQVVYISDNDREEFQPCSLESLARARNSKAFPYGPNRNGTWLIDFPERLPDAAETIERSVRRAVENMLSEDQRMGLTGVRGFGASYSAWPATFDGRLAEAMRGIVIFVLKAGTGGAMFRSLQAGFLEEASSLLRSHALNDAARIYRELTDAWRGLATAADADDDAIAAHRAGVPYVERILELEHRGVDAMQAWLSSR